VLLAAAIGIAGITHLGDTRGEAQPAKATISYSEAKPIVERLRPNLPADLATIPESQLDAAWNPWMSQLDRRIRARLERGDEDSAINFLLFGTSFTKLPRALNDSAKLGGRERAAAIVRGRIADLANAIASPGSNERLIFVRGLVRRNGIDPDTAAGREQTRVYFRTLMTRINGEVDEYAKTIESARGTAELAARSTLFRTRGLSSDTSIRPDFAIDRALELLTAKGILTAGSVRRIAIVRTIARVSYSAASTSSTVRSCTRAWSDRWGVEGSVACNAVIAVVAASIVACRLSGWSPWRRAMRARRWSSVARSISRRAASGPRRARCLRW
jgi:hypothetical protein